MLQTGTKNISQAHIEHVQLVTTKPFQSVITALEVQLGRFDFQVDKELSQTRDLPRAITKFAEMEGSSGLMIFSMLDHGALLENGDKQRQAMQYVIGNPLIARQMTCHDLRAALYAPLRILVYENDDNQTCIEYDQPSSLFGQFGNANVNPVARGLEQKLETLIANAIKP